MRTLLCLSFVFVIVCVSCSAQSENKDPILDTFILVKGGSFQMGNLTHGPIHEVTVSDFYLAQTEVTQAQWRAVMGENPSDFKDCDLCPVEQVSWDDVQMFLTKLNNRSGGVKHRLPTEAEWEYAARGGIHNKGYSYANAVRDDIEPVAWYSENAGEKTHPVKGKAPNALGLYDMTGNVWEWCSDWYENYGAAAQTNPRGASSGTRRVFRGGSWYSDPIFCIVSFRFRDATSNRYNFLGFRLARDVAF